MDSVLDRFDILKVWWIGSINDVLDTVKSKFSGALDTAELGK
jgi:hypothetical protein